MAGGPFDYSTPASAQVNPFGTALQGFALGQQVRQQEDQRQFVQQQLRAQMELQRQYQQDASTLLSNPNAGAKDFAGFQLKYPQFREATKGAFEQLSAEQQQNRVSTLSRVYSALNSGRKDLALSIANDNLKALENSGGNPQEINALKGNIQLIETLPLDQARNAAAMALSTVADPKQFSSTFGQLGQETRAQQEQPFKQTKLEAEAQYAGPKAQAEIENTKSQIAERASRLGLDRDKFNLEFDTTLAKLQGKGAVTLSAGMEKLQAEAVGSAGVAQQNSDDAANLAQQFRSASDTGRGSFSTLGEYMAKVTGNQDAMTTLRKRYIQMKNSASLSLLPTGPASDTDIRRIDAGFLPETANSKEIADWLDSFSRVQKAAALRDNAKADWLSEVGNTGKAPRDIEVSGIKVPAGTSFNDFVRRGLKPQDITNPQAQPQGAQPAAQPRYMDPSTWGRTNTVQTPAATSMGVTQLPPA